MSQRLFMSAALAVTLAAPAAVAHATPAADVTASPLGIPMMAVSMTPGAPSEAPQPVLRGATTLESIRWKPRYRRPRDRDRDYDRFDEDRSNRTTGFGEVHGGVFDPQDGGTNGAIFGFRLGTSIEDHVQLGVQVDWSHRSDHRSAIVGTSPLPGGGTVERRLDLASSSFDLVPVLAFLQVSPTGGRSGGPYLGIAGGYETLFVNAEDFTTGEDFDATYDGWGWQAWGGFAFPMSRQSRLNLEVFTNGGDLDREVDDPGTGLTYREIVNVNGSGVRGGVSWSF